MNSPTLKQRLAERTRPPGSPVMRQCWDRLLFLHWKWEPRLIQRTLPAGLAVDVHDGHAWVGLVPFFMRRVRPRGLPAVPGLSNFLELNVRTYVHDAQGRPGVWFYSLDANQWLAVKLARALFHLPYEHATMSAAVDAKRDEVDYRTQRQGAGEPSRFVYRPTTGAVPHEAAAGSQEFFLVERYRLFAHDEEKDELYTGRVHHAPYQITPAEVPEWSDTALRMAGLPGRRRAPDHVCLARSVEVEVWPLQRLRAPERVEEESAAGAGAAMPA